MSDSTKKPEDLNNPEELKEDVAVEQQAAELPADAAQAEVEAVEEAQAEAKKKPAAKAKPKAEKPVGPANKAAKPTAAKAEEKPAAAKEEKPAAKAPAPAKKKPAGGGFKEKVWEPMLRPVVTLVAICLVTSLLLGLTNMLTAPRIAENAAAAAEQARLELLPAAGDSGFIQLVLKGEPANVTAIYKAANSTGYVIEAYGIGYGGRVPVMVGFGEDNKISGVKFLENNETPGLGKKLNTDPSFSAQFTGRVNERILPGDIDGIASSTISTGAALTGINAAISYFNTSVLGIKEGEKTPEEIRAELLPGATAITAIDVSGENITEGWAGDDGSYIIYATAKGFESTITAAVAVDGTGTILGLWLDTSGDTAGFGKEVSANTTFTEQFTGKTDAEGVEWVSGATVTSKAVAEAVQTALDYFNANLAGGAPPPASSGGSSSSSAPASSSAPEPTPDEVRAGLLPDATAIEPIDITAEGVTEAYGGDDGNYIIYATGKGYESTVTAAVAMDADGVILGIWLDTSGETPGFGRDVAENSAYLESFAGQTSADDVDGVSGASETSKAVAEAVNAALAALEQAKEAS